MVHSNISSGTATYARLLRYVGRYWAVFLVSILGLVIHSAAEIAFVDLLGYITDTVGALTSSGQAATNVPSTGITALFANGFIENSNLNQGMLVIPIMLVVISLVRGLGYSIGSYSLAYVANCLLAPISSQPWAM